jgi:tellurite resistance protein
MDELTVGAAIAIGFSDGNLADTEGTVIQRWMTRRLEVLGGETREKHKQRLNTVLRESFELARAGRLDLGEIVGHMSGVADLAGKMDAIELCLDVMSADGHADKNELERINKIAQRLDVDLERFKDLKDKRLSGLSASLQSATDYHALLNIDPSWDKAKVKAHLNKLYAQWNSRAESLEDSEKRFQAERMLETIANARRALIGSQ